MIFKQMEPGSYKAVPLKSFQIWVQVARLRQVNPVNFWVLLF